MSITRRRFNTLARAFGLKPIPMGKRTPRHFYNTVRTTMPLCGVDGWRQIGASDAFLAMHSEPQVVYTLGHEAGHIVHNHHAIRGRYIAHEIQADMWGVLALDAYGYSRRVASETLSAILALWPGVDAFGEITARLEALEQVVARPADNHLAIAFLADYATTRYPLRRME